MSVALPIRIVRGTSATNVAAARRLFREYAEQIGVDLCFEGFDEELAHLDRMYGPPRGELWVVWSGRRAVGCVGLRPYSRTDAEMKRLYVRSGQRGLGLGRRLVETLLGRAHALGFRAVRLDTLPSMSEAQALYRSLGFRTMAPYVKNPVAGSVYLRRTLGSWRTPGRPRTSTASLPPGGRSRIVGVHHVQLAVPPGGEARARRFYGRLLGLREIRKPPTLALRGGVWFQCGTEELHLGVERRFRPAARAHPAWVVRDLSALRVRLVRGGVAVRPDRSWPGFRRFYALDPFGNRLEFLEPARRRPVAHPTG